MTNTRLRGIVWCGLLSVLSWFLPTQEVQADVLHYTFVGNVIEIAGLGSAPPFDRQSTLTVLYTYNTDNTDITKDVNTLPGLGQYEKAGDSLSLTLGTYSASWDSSQPNQFQNNVIFIYNNFGGGGDIFQVVSALVGGEVNGTSPFALSLTLVDSSGTVFDSEALGTLPPSISSFDFPSYSLSFGLGQGLVIGDITSVSLATVPLPPAVILFGAGLVALVGLGARNWQQKRQLKTLQ